MFDLQDTYELSKIEVRHVLDAPETPKEVELQVDDGRGWNTVKRWQAVKSKNDEVTEFPPSIGQQWRFMVNSTWGGEKGSTDAGPYIMRIRFFGKKDGPKRQRPKARDSFAKSSTGHSNPSMWDMAENLAEDVTGVDYDHDGDVGRFN